MRGYRKDDEGKKDLETRVSQDTLDSFTATPAESESSQRAIYSAAVSPLQETSSENYSSSLPFYRRISKTYK